MVYNYSLCNLLANSRNESIAGNYKRGINRF